MQHFKSNSWGYWYLCPAVNLSFQLKQRPCTFFLYMSSHDKCLSRADRLAGVTWLGGGRVRGVFWGGGRMNRLCLVSCSSLILAKLMTSLRDCGLNIRIPSEISIFRPPYECSHQCFLCPTLYLISKLLKLPLIIPQCPHMFDFWESFIKIFTAWWSEMSP